MNPWELIFGILLVLALMGLAGFFGWRQRQTLAVLHHDYQLSGIERGYLRSQVWRRSICCILLALFAVVLVGWFFMEEDFRQLRPVIGDEEAARIQRTWVWFYTGYWIFALLLLMAIVTLAALDFLATARYGLRHKRKLLSDHQALLALEAAKLRQKRHELN